MATSEKLKTKSTTASKGTELRKAGCLEQYFNVRSKLQYQSWVFVVAQYEHEAGVTLSKPLLFTALERMVRSNSALVAQLPTPPAAQMWIKMSSLDLNKVVTFLDRDSSALAAVMEELYSEPIAFADDLPLWHLWVLKDNYLILGLDHGLFDGQSGLAFHATLLPILRSIPAPPAEHSGVLTDLPADAEFTPALEQVMDASVPLKFGLQELSKLLFPFLYPKLAGAWSAHAISKTLVLDNRVRIARVGPADAKRLLELAHTHETTLTGTLHTLALVAFARLIPKHERECARSKKKKAGAKTPQAIASFIPISLRRFSGTSPLALCQQVSMLFAVHPLPPVPGSTPAPGADGAQQQAAPLTAENFPWPVAQALSAKLKRKAPRSIRTIGMLKLMFGKYELEMNSGLGGKRLAALELSNLGVFPALAEIPPAAPATGADGAPPSYDAGKWRMREAFFSQGDATLGAAIKLSVTGTPEAGVGITVTWGREAIDDEFGDEFARMITEGIQSLLG